MEDEDVHDSSEMSAAGIGNADVIARMASGAKREGASGRARLTCACCPRHCHLHPGQRGYCRARVGAEAPGGTRPESYGRLTSIAVDPIEKKPIALWHPGTRVLSVGSYGCTMDCPYCQNARIAAVGPDDVAWREVSPEELVALASRLREQDPRMTGIAYTYNEPLASWEYVRDCARLAHERGLVNVLVSNGMASPEVLDQLAGLIDAANIDLKARGREAYAGLGGDWDAVRATIARLAADPACHLEITTLVVPGISDDARDIDALAAWLARLSPEIPYHLSRFFPAHRMLDVPPTPLATMRELRRVAGRHLVHVLLGNC